MIPQHLDDRPEMKYINRYVSKEICASGPGMWLQLGTELLDATYVAALYAIKSDITECSTCCSEMFRLWLEREPEANWRDLITALKQISLNRLASDTEGLLSLEPTSKGASRIDQEVMKDGHAAKPFQDCGQAISMPQKQPLLSFNLLSAEFGHLLVRIRRILSKSPKWKDNLEACKEYCKYLKASNKANVPLFSSEKISNINNCTDFKQLFEIVNQHLSWDEHSILTQIIDECDSDEAEQEFSKYKKKMAISKALDIINSTKSDLPSGFESFCVIIDKPYKKLTVDKYEEIKSFIFDNLDTRRYVTTGYIRVLFDSLHLSGM